MQRIETIVHDLSFQRKKRKEIFLNLPPQERIYVFLRLTKRLQQDIIVILSDEELAWTLEQLDPDKATDIMQILPEKRQKTLMEILGEELKKGIELLMKFDPQTAAGLMNLDYVQVQGEDKVVDVLERLKIHEQRTGRMPAVILMDGTKVKGYIPGHTFGFARKDDKVKKYVRNVPTVPYNAKHEEVLNVFRRNPHGRIAVIGENGNLIGIIYSDDILRLIEEKGTSSLYKFAGISHEESVLDNAAAKINYRYKWLVINLATAFLAAFTVGIFEDTIAKYVLLAVYMPIVAGMGGNAATQTLAVVVRGITLHQIGLKNCWPVLRRELVAGFVNGLINGLIVAGVVIIFNDDLRLAIVLAVAMVVNLLVAAFFGTLVPLIMKKLDKDPATSATIFITTATDVLGFLAFLGLAAVVLR